MKKVEEKVPQPKKSNAKKYLAIPAIATVGTAVYFATREKKDPLKKTRERLAAAREALKAETHILLNETSEKIAKLSRAQLPGYEETGIYVYNGDSVTAKVTSGSKYFSAHDTISILYGKQLSISRVCVPTLVNTFFKCFNDNMAILAEIKNGKKKWLYVVIKDVKQPIKGIKFEGDSVFDFKGHFQPSSIIVSDQALEVVKEPGIEEMTKERFEQYRMQKTEYYNISTKGRLQSSFAYDTQGRFVPVVIGIEFRGENAVEVYDFSGRKDYHITPVMDIQPGDDALVKTLGVLFPDKDFFELLPQSLVTGKSWGAYLKHWFQKDIIIKSVPQLTKILKETSEELQINFGIYFESGEGYDEDANVKNKLYLFLGNSRNVVDIKGIYTTSITSYCPAQISILK